MYTQLLKCSYTLYVVPYPTENYKQWLPNGISWLFIDLLPFWPYDARFPALYDVAVSWLRLKTLIDCIPHPYWIYTKCFSTLRCSRWVYGCIIMGPRGASLPIVKQAPHGALFRSDLVWSGKRCVTYSYVISTGARNSSHCHHRLWYGST